MEFEEFKLYENEHDLRSRINILLKRLKKIQAWLGIEPWLFSMTGRIAISGHRKGEGSISGHSWIFFNQFGCSFYCEGHVHPMSL